MRRARLHLWIFLGIAGGALGGTLLNRAHYGDFRAEATAEARRQVEQAGGTWDSGTEAGKEREIIAGVERRFKATWAGAAADGIGRLFLALLKMIIVPLVLASLVCGMSGMGDFKRLGKIGWKTAAWYGSTTLIAILTGLLLVNAISPGVGVDLALPTTPPSTQAPDSAWDMVVAMVPSNLVQSMAAGDTLPIITFALLFGGVMLAVDPARRAPVVAFFEGFLEIIMKLTMLVISLAPIGVMALVARIVAGTGPAVFGKLAMYAVTVGAGLAIHFFVTLPFLCWLFTKRNPYRVMRAMSPALLTAFSTASSSATLPVSLERMEKGVGVSNRVASFVLPLGATVNMDGTALYECVATIFVAQLYAAQHADYVLTPGMQVTIVMLSLAVSVGAAGIPSAGLVMMVIIFKAVGLPLELTGILWAVDRPLDMGRTTVNVWSDMMGAVAVAHGEGEIDERVLFRPA